MSNLLKIIDSEKTVFSKNDLRLFLDFSTDWALDKYIYRSIKKGDLQKLSYGIYGLKKYNSLELATKLKKNSYISLETVLKKSWVIFQYYESIFSVSDNSVTKTIDGQRFEYQKIKNFILLNPKGLIYENNTLIASPERAVCDKIYLSKNYYFDDISGLNLEELEEISQIYNKRVILEVKKLIQNENK